MAYCRKPLKYDIIILKTFKNYLVSRFWTYVTCALSGKESNITSSISSFYDKFVK